MPPDGSIAAVHLWKRFRGDRGRSLLRDEIERLRSRRRGDLQRGWTWALRDVDFHVEPGESIGLFGANGSGKSTLLKLLSRVMYPYAGSVQVQGRVGALIEVSSGIHPELTGEENVYLFGSLLGLSRKNVSQRFDQIVAFAEVESAVDRQVKFYSSGMKMRLGFAVAAFLEPDVLMVDEVLAVGDASFQQKCLDRMRAVLSQGTTLVFVSHDLASVEATCTRGIWLDSGTIQADGPIGDSMQSYRRFIEESAESTPLMTGPVRLLKVEVRGVGGGPARTQQRLDITMVIETDIDKSAPLFLGISEGTATPIFSVSRELLLSPGQLEVRCTIAHLPLPRGRFYLWAGIIRRERDLLAWHPAAHFDVEGPDLDAAPQAIVRLAPVHVDVSWATERS